MALVFHEHNGYIGHLKQTNPQEIGKVSHSTSYFKPPLLHRLVLSSNKMPKTTLIGEFCISTLILGGIDCHLDIKKPLNFCIFVTYL